MNDNRSIKHVNLQLQILDKISKNRLTVKSYKLIDIYKSEYAIELESAKPDELPFYKYFIPDIYIELINRERIIVEIACHLRKEDFLKLDIYKRNNVYQKWILDKDKKISKNFIKFEKELIKRGINYDWR